MEIKIGDFGLAWSLNSDDERKITLWGTPNYIAPEVLLNSKKGYSYEIDVWAIGVIGGGIELKFYTMVVINFLNRIYIKFKRYYFNHWRSIYKLILISNKKCILIISSNGIKYSFDKKVEIK